MADELKPNTTVTGSPAFSLGAADLYSLLISALISGVGAVLATISQMSPEHFANLGPLAPLATAVCLVIVATLRDWIAAPDLSINGLQRLGRSIALAVGGAVIAYAQSLFVGGFPTATAVAVWAFLINAARKFVFNTKTA